VPLLRSIHVIRIRLNARLREVLDDVYRRVEDGPLGRSDEPLSGVFSEMAINMVRAGARADSEDALERVSHSPSSRKT